MIELDEKVVTIEYFHARRTTAGATDPTSPIDLWGAFDPVPLPSGLLPEVIEYFAIEWGRLIGADASGLAMAALAVCAAALSDHTRLQVQQNNRNWTKSARIWVGLIGNPSMKKSPIIRRAIKPLRALDDQLWRVYVAALERYEALPADQRKIAEHPKQKRLRLEDTTIEAAQEVLKDSPDGVLCIQHELSGWFGAMDKYSSARGAAKDRGFWLQAYDGGSYAFNRIKRGAGLIENLSISLLGGIQPEPLRQIAAESVDDGLLQRLTPILLRPGTVSVDEPDVRDTGGSYDELVARLHHRELPLETLRFAAGAQGIRDQLERKHLDLMALELTNKKVAAHIGKYDGLFARLCVLWHCIEGGGSVITEDTARRVATFMHHFLLPHAFAFYLGMLGLSNDHDRLTAVAGYILAHGLERVTNRDIQRGDRTMRGLSRHETENIFEQLDALGWLTRVPGPRAASPSHWIVNPDVHRLFAERAKREVTKRANTRDLIKEIVERGRTP